jgi:uncharacterized membrane protein YqgA involved in biofilm formation
MVITSYRRRELAPSRRLVSVLRGEALVALVSAGGVLILGICLKLLNLVDVKVGNFLAALIIAPGLVGIVSRVN